MHMRLLKVVPRRLRIASLVSAPESQHICPVCLSLGSQPQYNKISTQPAFRSSSTGTESRSIAKPPRTHLRDTLLQLQEYAPSYINQSRLLLALRGLEQPDGEETIRLGIFGVSGKTNSLKRAKELARLLIADPLKSKTEWEHILHSESSRTVLLKIGSNISSQGNVKESGMFKELFVSSPILDKHNVEILVLELDPSIHQLNEDLFIEALLEPKIKIPTSRRYAQITMPIHRALLVSEDLRGAAMILGYPSKLHSGEITKTAIDLRVPENQKETLPCQIVDVDLASQALDSFRQSTQNASIYEKKWSASGLPEILNWLKQETSTKSQMSSSLQILITSVLQNAKRTLEMDQTHQVALARSGSATPVEISRLRQELQKWSCRAHTELRDQLEVAFNSRAWCKLKWWKLFWRVDDVSMVASSILNQRFLTRAEQEVIFLAGRIKERGITKESEKTFPNPVVDDLPKARLGAEPPAPQLKDFVVPTEDDLHLMVTIQPWPQDIRLTRFYMSQKTVPALQALAQKLVIQTLSTSSLATAFSVLAYLSSASIDPYEAGIVAAFGIVLSLKRIQSKWEGARKFWEDEVQEEGRKAIKTIEMTVNTSLTVNSEISVDQETQRAKSAIQAAEEALNSYVYNS
ncbi:hypothetical protein K3495_g2992 [Podosphaera aphanis]|nr:hypothetical protein K3495_g2992 [Podosphaera aphanis]